MSSQTRPLSYALASLPLLALLAGAAGAQNGIAAGRLAVSDPVIAPGLTLVHRPATLSVRLQNQTDHPLPAPAVDLIVPSDVLLDPPEALTGNMAPGAEVTRRWTLTAEHSGAYPVQLRVRAEGQPEQTQSLSLAVIQEPEDLDTRGDRHARIDKARDGSWVFRNESLVGVLQHNGDNYGPLVLYPASRVSTIRSEPVGIVPILAQSGSDTAVFTAAEEKTVPEPLKLETKGKNRLRLRGKLGDSPVEAELTITDDPWISFEVSATGRSGDLRALPLQAVGEGPREFLMPGVAFGEGPEPAPIRTPDPLEVTIPLMAVGRAQSVVGMLWNRPQDGETPVHALFGGDDRGVGAFRMELSTSGAGSGRKDQRLAGKILVLPFRDDAVSAVREWGQAYGSPIISGYSRSLDSARRLARTAYSKALWNESFGGWSPGLEGEKPLPPVRESVTPAALLLESDSTSGDLKGQVDRAVSELRKAGSVNPILAYRTGGVFSSLDEERRRLQPIIDDQLASGAWTWETFQLTGPKPAAPLGSPGEISLGVVTARALPLLRYAAWTGDSMVAGSGIKALEFIDHTYRVPRGGQVSGLPLQTPSIVSATEAAECYLLGYQLSGEQRYMDRARYWADAALTFVYFWGEKSRPALFGASRLAVGSTTNAINAEQWAGLHLARVLRDVSQVRPDGFYDYASEAIVASGIRQQWESGAQAGLLPQMWDLRDGKPQGLALAPRPLLEAIAPLKDLHVGPGHIRMRVGPDRLYVAGGATLFKPWTSSMRLRLNLHSVSGDTFLTVLGAPDKPLSVEYNSSPLLRAGIPVGRSFLRQAESETEQGWNYDPATQLLIMRLHHGGGEDHLEIRWPDPKDRTPIDRVDPKIRPKY